MMEVDKENSDANNNNKQCVEKYSLRPRSLRQKTEKIDLKKDFISIKLTKRNLGEKKTKQKPPPLSKYRRKTANARERNRMREINIAFETLRKAVPHISSNIQTGNEKLTKITTLRLAMKYIQTLRQTLDNSNENLNDLFYSDSDLDILLSDSDSLQLHSDISDNLTSPSFSEPSLTSEPTFSENSPAGFSETHDFHDQSLSFSDSVIDSAEFNFDSLTASDDFCEDFLNSQSLS